MAPPRGAWSSPACDGGEQFLNRPPANYAPTVSIASSSNVLMGPALTVPPGAGDVGIFNVIVTVSDGKAHASDQASITVWAAAAGRATFWRASSCTSGILREISLM